MSFTVKIIAVMDFYGVVKKIDELKKELEQTTLSAIEKDIIKSKIADTYLVLFEEQKILPPPATAQPPMQKEFVVEENVSNSQQPVEPEIPQKKPLNIDYKTLVDTFLEKEPTKQTPPEDQSLLSKISHTKIIDLKRSIAMNDRFIFIKELFNNDFDTYNRYINDLNGCENIQQAEQYLAQLKQQYEWNEENETVRYFLELIGRKFC